MAGDYTRFTFDPKKHYSSVRKQQGRVDLDADWNEQADVGVHRVKTEALDVIGVCGAPQDNAGFGLQAQGSDLIIGAGRLYVDGILCENEQAVSITAQPDLPAFAMPESPGAYIAYAHVWERELTALDDPSIREVALGGPDTCTRTKTVWQVNLLAAPSDEGTEAPGVTCSTEVAAWDLLIAASTAQLAARSQPDATASDPCIVPSRAGYRRLENQLYRVEIHDPSTAANGATFKWSRDNGSVVTSWTGTSGVELTVASTGRDTALGFAAGQWIELIDDTHELKGLPGTLVRLVKVEGQTLTLDTATATGSVNPADFSRNPEVRRWDSAGAVAVTTATWVDLEDGVQVEFSTGTLKTGDYWLIPARTLTGDVEWPRDSSNNPISRTPQGIEHHYCRLAVVQFDGQTWSVIDDCRPLFPPLTAVGGGEEQGIHITDVRTLRSDVTVPNDSILAVDDFVSGLSILCDAPVSPESIKQATCFVTLDIPYPLDLGTAGAQFPLIAFQPFIVPGLTVAQSSGGINRIAWRPRDPKTLFTWLQQLLAAMVRQEQVNRLLTHLTLKGNFIWGQNDPSLYLDGEAFGIAQAGAAAPQTALRLPSGNGRRGGDFEMWFSLAPPMVLSSFTLSATSVIAGGSLTGTLNLNQPAAAGGAVVTLSATAQDASGATVPGVQVVTLPPNVTVPGGQATTTFKITTRQGAQGATVTITATLGANFTAQFTITGPPIPVPTPIPLPTPGPVRTPRSGRGGGGGNQ